MKKTLLTTTAIVAAFVATDAQANSLQVNVGGFADFQAGYVSDDIVDATAGANDVQFNTDSEIHVSVEGAADNGLEYGAVLELETNVGATTDKYNDGANADKAYLFVQGGWGRVEMGENTGAEEALAVNTSDFASATGGVGGDFYRYVALPAGADVVNTDNGTSENDTVAFAGLRKPLLALAEGGNTGVNANEDATKLTYYSPRFAGFQAGVSYTANSADTSRTNVANVGTADNEDVFSGGINYVNQFDQIGVSASLTGLQGDAKLAGATDVEGYAAGANLTFAGFTVGGSYGDYLDTFGAADADYYDLGLGYAAGPFSVSATYFKSSVEQTATLINNGADNTAGTADDDNAFSAGGDFENIVIGADYQLAPGLVPYAEVSFFEIDGAGAATTAADNEGTVVIVGTELSF